MSTEWISIAKAEPANEQRVMIRLKDGEELPAVRKTYMEDGRNGLRYKRFICRRRIYVDCTEQVVAWKPLDES